MADTPQQYRPENQLSNANRDTLNISQPGEGSTNFNWDSVRQAREADGRKTVGADPSINLKDVGLSAASAPLELVRGGAEVFTAGNDLLNREAQQGAKDSPNPLGIDDQMMQVMRANPGNSVANALNSGVQAVGRAAGAASDAITSGQSEGARQAAAMPFVERGADGNLKAGAGLFDKDAWMINAIPTVTQLLTTGAFAGLTGAAARNAVEQSVYKKLSQSLPDEVARATARETADQAAARAGKTAFVGANTVAAQGGAAVDMRNQINDLNFNELMQSPTFQSSFAQIDADPQYQNLNDTQKLTLARQQVADQAANAVTSDPKLLAVNLAATTLGDHTLLNLITKKGATSGVLAGIGTGAAAEGSTEFAQGATQRYVQNQQLIDTAGQKIDPMQGVVETGASNAVLGAGIGAAAGTIGGVRSRGASEASPSDPTAPPAADVVSTPDAPPATADAATAATESQPAPTPVADSPTGPAQSQPDAFRDTPAYLRNDPRIQGFAEDSEVQQALSQQQASPTADELIQQQIQGGDQGYTPDELRILEEADRLRQERTPRLPAPGQTSTIAMGGSVREPVSPDEPQAGSGPQFRGGEQVRGQQVIPAERQARAEVGRASRVIDGEVVPGNAIEDKNIIFSGGDQPNIDEQQAGRAPQFRHGETSGQRNVRQFSENNPSDNMLMDGRRRIAGTPESDAVGQVARGETPSRLQFMASGRPFSTERSARASRWSKESGAVVEPVEGGFAVRIPEKVNGETRALPDERTQSAEVPAVTEQNQQSGISADEGVADAPANQRSSDATARAESRSGDDLVPVRAAADADPSLTPGSRFTVPKSYGRWSAGDYRIESVDPQSGDIRLRDQNDKVHVTNERGMRSRIERGIAQPVADESVPARQDNAADDSGTRFSRSGANLRGGYRLTPESFTASTESEPQMRRGMSKANVDSIARQFVRDLNGAAKVDVQVVGSQQEAAALVPGGIPPEYGTVHAMYQPRDRRVVLVADNLASAADVRAKLRHEVLAHHGLETVVGADHYRDIMRAISQTRGSNNQEIRRAWDSVRREYAGETQETQAHEFLAHMAEVDTSSGLGAAWDRLVGRIITALRSVGLMRSNDSSPSEIRNILRSIADSFRNGDNTPPRGTRQGDTMLSQSSDVKAELRDLRDSLVDKYGLQKLNVTSGNGVIDLNLIVAGDKGRGNGTKALQELMDFADRKGLTIALTPSSDFGGSKSRLTDYYKRLGFVENKGRNKDFEISESMYRPRIKYSRAAAQDIQQDINRKMGFNPETGRTEKAKSFFEKIKATDKEARKAWLDKVGKALNTRTFDGLAPIKYAEDSRGGINAQNSAYIGARMAAGSGAVTSATMEYGLPKYNKDGGVVERMQGTGKEDSLIGILDSLGNKREDFLKWIAGNRSEQLMAEGRENLFTAEEIQAMKALRNGNEQLFDAAKKKYDAFTRAILDFQVDTGLLSKEMRDQWADAWYIPYYRQVDEESGQVAGPWTTKGIANQRSPAKKLKGGEANINDPIENLFNYTAKAIDAGMKNEAMRRAVANLGDTDMMERIDKPNKFDYEAIGKTVVKVNLDGEENLVRIHDPELYRAFTMIDLQRSDAAFMKAARQAKRVLTIGTTSMPDFILRNFMRDSLHSWAINKDGFKPIVASWQGLKKGLKTDDTLIDMMFAGATFGGGYSNVYDPQGTARTIRGVLRKKGYTDSQVRQFESTIVTNGRQALDKISSGLDKYKHVSEAAENANRIATYEAALKSGKSKAEAAFQSRDLMDFSMQGASKLVINLSDMLPFFNARLQGLSKLGRAIKEDPKEVGKRSAYIAGASLALLALNWDNDKYEELPDWDKDTYWHAFIGDQHIRIPKPFEIGLLFGTLPERAVRLMAGRDSGAKFGKLVAQEFANTMAFTPIPQVALPIAESYVNYSFFTGNPIENMSDANLIAKARYDDRTSMIAREIGELTGMSPKQIDHVVQGYTGSLGGYIMGATDFVLRRTGDSGAVPSARMDELPVIKSFFRGNDPAKSTHFSEDFYKMMTEASEVYSTVRDYRKQGRIDDANELAQENSGKLAARKVLNHTQQQVRQLNQQIEMIKASKTLTADEKRERIDRAFDARNKVVQMVVQRVRPDFDSSRD